MKNMEKLEEPTLLRKMSVSAHCPSVQITRLGDFCYVGSRNMTPTQTIHDHKGKSLKIAIALFDPKSWYSNDPCFPTSDFLDIQKFVGNFDSPHPFDPKSIPWDAMRQSLQKEKKGSSVDGSVIISGVPQPGGQFLAAKMAPRDLQKKGFAKNWGQEKPKKKRKLYMNDGSQELPWMKMYLRWFKQSDLLIPDRWRSRFHLYIGVT